MIETSMIIGRESAFFFPYGHVSSTFELCRQNNFRVIIPFLLLFALSSPVQGSTSSPSRVKTKSPLTPSPLARLFWSG